MMMRVAIAALFLAFAIAGECKAQAPFAAYFCVPLASGGCQIEGTSASPIPVAVNPASSGVTQITASTTGTTGATTATLAGAAGKSTYICGFAINANATGAATGNATITGTISGTLNFNQFTAPLASGMGYTTQTFNPCIVASGANTAIAVVSAAPGTGGTISVTAWGFQF